MRRSVKNVMHLVQLTPFPDESDILVVDAAVARSVELTPGQQLILRAGLLETPATVSIKNQEPATQNYIAAGLLNKLLLPADHKIILRLVKNEPVANIGPVIGILVSRNKRLKRPPFSNQKQLLRRFIYAGKKLGAVVFAFNPDGIDEKNLRIEGYYPGTNDAAKITWQKSYFPFPDVVHNRVLSRTTEQTPAIRQALKITGAYGIKCFNPKFLNKWETHNILYKNPPLRKYLPETVKYQSGEQLYHFLKKYPLVYLKPWHGSLGKDIQRISKDHGRYCYVYRQSKRTVSSEWNSPADMIEAVGSFVGKRSYLIQQGLNFISYFGQVFDIRVMIQKNLTGSWEVSAIVARIGKEGSPFPNIAAGGEAQSIEEVWRELFNRDWAADPVREKITDLAEKVAITLDRELGNFGELGLDVGIDAKGRPWLIEVNSKPSRKVFPKMDKILKARSIRLPMEYAVYWAGFAKEQQSREPQQ